MKKLEATNLVFQWNFVLNSVKHKFSPASIANSLCINGANENQADSICTLFPKWNWPLSIKSLKKPIIQEEYPRL